MRSWREKGLYLGKNSVNGFLGRFELNRSAANFYLAYSIEIDDGGCMPRFVDRAAG